MRANPSGPRGASSGDVPPPPSSTGVVVAKTSGAAAADTPPPTTSDDSDIQRMLDHVLTVQAVKDRFWWTFLMRFVAGKQIWHGFDILHRHLLLMMDFDCPLAFRHKKGSSFLHLYLFLFSGGEFIFVG